MTQIIIAVLIILSVFGSVAMLKPSPRQQRLAKLRMDAIKLGLHVKLDTLKVNSKKTGVRDDIVAARYERFNTDVKSQALRWCVVRQAGWDQEGLPDGWSWHNMTKRPDLDKLNELLLKVSDDVVVVEAYDNRASIMTLENKGSSAELINQWVDDAQKL
ncbi:MAG: hypothetical protein ACJAZ6_002205 [Oleispira sp.]|jgi:hypothetical protein